MQITFTLFSVVLISTILFALQFYLCKKGSKVSLILPTVVACFFVLIGIYALIVAGIMFGIYFIMKHIRESAQSKQSELDKMNIQDLE